MTDKLSQGEINNLDRYIEQLLQCKPLSEVEVKTLCDKVRNQLLFSSLVN